MTADHSPVTRIGLTGAFERDNFGDLLYPLLPEKAWGPRAETSLLSRFPSSTEQSLGRAVEVRENRLLDGRDFDAVVLAGGESLAISMVKAAQLLPGHPGAAIADPAGLPYVPEPNLSVVNFSTPLFINSVGAWPPGQISAPHGRRLRAALRSAQGITVRDRASKEFLYDSWGIEARLIPDIVHAAAEVWQVSGKDESRVAIQVSDEFLQRFGVDEFAAKLVDGLRASDRKPAKAVLFAAGTAPGHDDLGQLRRVAEVLADEWGQGTVSVSEEREPLGIVDLIAGSGLVIGHSLHVRVVAASYGVPRISLARTKTERYSADWDPNMPAGVIPETLGLAIQEALADNRRDAAAVSSSACRASAWREVHALLNVVEEWRERRGAVASQRLAAGARQLSEAMTDRAVGGLRRTKRTGRLLRGRLAAKRSASRCAQ